MPGCSSQHGVRKMVISFRDCDTEETRSNVEHLMNGDTIPTVNACNRILTPLPGGKTQVSEGNGYTFTADIQRVDAIPLAWYQGCAAIDVSVEWWNGRVWTLQNGSVTGAAESDGNSVSLTATFQEFDEKLSLPIGGGR